MIQNNPAIPRFSSDLQKKTLKAINESARALFPRMKAVELIGMLPDTLSEAFPMHSGLFQIADANYAVLAQLNTTGSADVFLIPSVVEQHGTSVVDMRPSFFQKLLDNLPAQIAVFNDEFRYLFVNRYGIHNEEIRTWIVGKTDYDYVNYRNKDISIADSRTAQFRECWENKVQMEWEEEQKQPDDSIKYFLRRLTPVLDENGNTQQLIGYGMDITELKKARIKLLISEEKYRHLVEESSDILYTTDPEGNFTYINQVAEKITGFSMDEMIGDLYLNFIRKDFVQSVYDFYINQRDSVTESSYLEFPIITKYGTELWVGQKVRMLFNDKEFLGVVSIARDITELKKAEHQLLTLITSLDDIVMEINEEFRFLNIWTANEDELFIPAEQMKGRTLRETLGDAFAEPFELAAKSVLEDGVTRTVEYKHPSDEKWYSARLTLLDDRKASEKRISLMIRNITEVKIAQEKLKQSQENLSALIENTSDIIYSIDTSFRLLSFNSRFAELYREIGWSPALSEKLPFELLGEEKKKMWLAIYADVFNGIERHIELPRTINRKNYIFEYSLSPILNTDKSVVGVAVFGRDITERKKAEKQMLQAQKIALRSNKSREQFIASMSHELRTPINTIIGSTLLIDQSKLAENERQYITNINDSSRFLLSMINDILDIAKIDSGKILLEKTTFTFDEIIRSVLTTFGEQARAKNIRLSVHADNKITHTKFTGDPHKLKQVLINLTGNALKFTDEGSIDISIDCLKEGPNSCDFMIRVKDTGIGMTSIQMRNIFKPFGQGSEQISKKYGGSGLGLIISKKIMQAMSGTINVTSDYGRGSEFVITFPLAHAEEEQPAKKETVSDPFGANTEILLVEDHDFNRYFLAKILSGKGFRVHEAESGMKALEVLRANPSIELVLLDLRMPDWDGYVTNRKIRNLKGKDFPVIALTAYTLKEEQEKCAEEGFVNFVVKPVDPEKLIAIIRNTLTELNPKGSVLPDYSLKNLRDTFGSEETVRELTEIFMKSADDFVSEMIGMKANNDFTGLAGLLHKLKPAAELFSVKDLMEITTTYQKDHSFSHNDAELIVNDVIRILKKLLVSMREMDLSPVPGH